MVKACYLLFLIAPTLCGAAGAVAGAVASTAASSAVTTLKEDMKGMSPAVKSDLRFVGFSLCAVSLLGIVAYLTVM
jgi:ABC-type lipoprotein release transport system permease subunit